MKIKNNAMFYIAFAIGLFIFPGCEKSQLTEEPKQEEANYPSIYRVSILDNTVEVEEMDKESISRYLQAKGEAGNGISQKSGNSQKAVGMANMGDDMATFNAIKNNGGVHGNTHYSGEFWIDLKFDSECLLVIDNKAYWGGTLTTYEVSEELQGYPFDVGWGWYWSVIDNGEGSGSDADELGEAFIVIPPGLVASDYGFETWCDYADYDYNLLDPPHYPHGHFPGDDPTNIQVDD